MCVPCSSFHRYSRQDRDVLVKRMMLEHAFGDENVLDLPQDVLAEVAAHDLDEEKTR